MILLLVFYCITDHIMCILCLLYLSLPILYGLVPEIKLLIDWLVLNN